MQLVSSAPREPAAAPSFLHQRASLRRWRESAQSTLGPEITADLLHDELEAMPSPHSGSRALAVLMLLATAGALALVVGCVIATGSW